MNNKRNISIIGGAGHVGFPLGLIFSSRGFKVNLIDKNNKFSEKENLLIKDLSENKGAHIFHLVDLSSFYVEEKIIR